MRRIHVFGDEAGDFVFQPPREGISRYFIIGTVTLEDCSIGDELLALRRELAWEGLHLDSFHATTDRQAIRNQVFERIAACSGLRFDATILDKRKTIEKYRRDPILFYKLAWYLHFKFVAPRIASFNDSLLVVASSLMINRKKKAVKEAVESVVMQVAPTLNYESSFLPALCDPCLQVADYCTWALQRKYEQFEDTRSYDLI
ncbi:MAG TPA: hypothetical protein VFK14_11380, partial [Solirubrobacterales bacterium]|nr:hypothetical protein [Solirubrobacterales bacterium]